MDRSFSSRMGNGAVADIMVSDRPVHQTCPVFSAREPGESLTQSDPCALCTLRGAGL